MRVRWSRIHAELGLAPVELTYELVVRAVEQRVRENDDLDWKQILPVDLDRKHKEFAKDVAAMANTRGGLIVFGVRDKEEQAVQLTPVPTGERERQRLRALVASHIRPLVAGLEIESLTVQPGANGFIVVSIPASPDAPHVVGERNEMGVPFRHGPHTQWMSEHQLERAYRDRFARQAGEVATLAGLVEDLEQQIDLDLGVWLAVVARPLTPLPAVLDRPDRAEVPATMIAASRLAARMCPRPTRRPNVFLGTDGDLVNNPRVGLRRWVVRSNYYAAPGASTDLIHIELHHDGSSAIGVGVSRWASRENFPDFHGVPTRIVESAMVEAVATTAAHARGRGHGGPVLVRATLLRPDSGLPFGAVDNHSGGFSTPSMNLIAHSRAPRAISPVEAEFAADAEPVPLRAAARQLTEDLLHQFGIPQTSVS